MLQERHYEFFGVIDRYLINLTRATVFISERVNVSIRVNFSNFSQGKGDCLEDEPARNNDYAYPDLPPGAMYNAEHQCRLQFGVREASVCSQLHEVNRDHK